MKLVPFESLGAVFYSPSVVTVAVYVAVCDLFSVKACDLRNWVRGHARSLILLPFKSLGTVPYSPFIVTMAIILYRLQDIETYW